MSEGLSIRKITSSIIGTSRVKAPRRQDSDSSGKRFQKQFEGEKDEMSSEDETTESEQTAEMKRKKKGKTASRSGDMPEPLNKNLGRKIDIHI